MPGTLGWFSEQASGPSQAPVEAAEERVRPRDPQKTSAQAGKGRA